MSLEHAKSIGKHSVFVACMHHAREPALLFREKGLVVESGAVFDMNLGSDFRGNFLQMLVRIMKNATLHGFGVFPSPYLDLAHAKTIGKQSVFVTCLHHAQQPVRFVCEKGLVVESGAVLYTIWWAHFR